MKIRYGSGITNLYNMDLLYGSVHEALVSNICCSVAAKVLLYCTTIMLYLCILHISVMSDISYLQGKNLSIPPPSTHQPFLKTYLFLFVWSMSVLWAAPSLVNNWVCSLFSGECASSIRWFRSCILGCKHRDGIEWVVHVLLSKGPINSRPNL